MAEIIVSSKGLGVETDVIGKNFGVGQYFEEVVAAAEMRDGSGFIQRMRYHRAAGGILCDEVVESDSAPDPESLFRFFGVDDES